MKTSTNRALGGLLCGFVFGIGLAVSRMTDPEKILGFLVLGPSWDPSLLLVMAAALVVTFAGYRIMKPEAPLFDTRFHLPGSTAVDVRLVAGAAIFGVGWGVAGYCPGPAITDIGSRLVEPLVFLAAFVAGSQGAALLFAPRVATGQT